MEQNEQHQAEQPEHNTQHRQEQEEEQKLGFGMNINQINGAGPSNLNKPVEVLAATPSNTSTTIYVNHEEFSRVIQRKRRSQH